MPSRASTPSNCKMTFRAEMQRLKVSEQHALIVEERLKVSEQQARIVVEKLAVADRLVVDLAVALDVSKRVTGALEHDNKFLHTMKDLKSQGPDEALGTSGGVLLVGLLKRALDEVNRKNALRVDLLAELHEVQQHLAASDVKVLALEEQVADGEKTIASLQMDSEQAYCYLDDDEVDAQCAAIWSGAGCHNSDDADDSTYDFAAMLAAARVAIRATRP